MRYKVGDYRVDTQAMHVCHGETVIPLRPKVFHLLAYLVTHHDRLVSKQELREAVWPGQRVSESTIDACLAAARKAVGDTGQTHSLIITRHGYGYYCLATLEDDDGPSILPEPEVPAGLLPLPFREGVHAIVTVVCCQWPAVVSGTPRQVAETRYQIQQTVQACLQTVVAPYEGTVYDMREEEVLLLFGAPVAQEDHAHRAVRVAASLHRILQDVGRVRVGVHTGPLLLGLGDATGRLTALAVGDTLSLARHLAALAPPGRPVLSMTTYGQVAGWVDTQRLALAHVDEPTASLTAFAVLRLHEGPTRVTVAAAARRLTPYVGRTLETALLEDRLQRVLAGHGQVVSLVGEAGIGKSRQLFEFRQRLATAHPRVAWHEGACRASGQPVPFLPLRALLQALVGLQAAPSAQALGAAVEAALQRLGGLASHRAALRLLLGLEPDDPASAAWEADERWTRLGEALHTFLRAWTRTQPLVLVVEDLHWVDSSTVTLLGTLIETVAGLPLLLVLTYRVGYTPSWPHPSFLTTLTMQRLSDTETLTLVQHLLGPAVLSTALQRQLLHQTAGIPLFVEEVVKTLHDVGAVQQDATGTWVVAEAATPHISVTLHALLAARLDRLSPLGRHVLQWAAVLGSTCPQALLADLVEDPSALQDALYELQHREILRGQADAVEPTYVFTHALLQEVAYDTLLQRQRQALHRAVGTALERRYADRLATYAPDCARHFIAAAVWDKALHYNLLAGAQAADSAANPEAQAYYTQALQAAGQMTPPPEPAVLARLYAKSAAVHLVRAAYAEAEAAYQQALAWSRHLDDRHGVLDALLGLSTVYTNWRRGEEAQAVLAQARVEVQALADPAHRADYLTRQVRLRTRGLGELREAMPDAEEAFQLAQGTPNIRLQAFATTALGRLLTWRGVLPRGRALLQEGVALAQQANQGFAQGMGLFFLGIADAALGAYEDAYWHYSALQTYARQADDRYWIARVPNALAGLWLDLGHLEAAWTACQEAEEFGRRWDWVEVQGHALVQRGAVALAQGQLDQAARCLTQAQALLDTDPWMRWRWHITLLQGWGRLALAQGALERAWTMATQARRLAQRTDSRKHVVRAQVLQGTILAAHGRVPAALRVLEPAVHGATGLQTPRELWQSTAALGQVYAQAGRESDAVVAYEQAAQIVTMLAAGLQTPGWRQYFVALPEVRAVSEMLGHERRSTAHEKDDGAVE